VHPSIRTAFCLAALCPASVSVAHDNSIRIDVVVDVTKAGEKVRRPTPDSPVYYYPYTSGFAARDPIPAGAEEPPPTLAVQHLIAVALANDGYWVMNKNSPPSLVLAFWWGYQAGSRAAMEQLVLGNEFEATVDENQSSLRVQTALSALDAPRYYLIVSALDYPAYTRKQHKVLWTARVSTELKGSHFDEVLPALIAAGARRFGRETQGPEFTQATITPSIRHRAAVLITENYITATRLHRPIQYVPEFVEVLRNGPIDQQ
jgi:hypothetical protein